MFGDECGADYPVFSLVEAKTEKSVVRTIQDRPIHFGQRDRQRFHLEPLVFGFFFVQPDMSYLRACVGAPRNHKVACLGPSKEQGILNRDPS